MGKVLSEIDVERYRRQGYLSPVDGLTAEEVVRYRAAFDELDAHYGGRLKPLQCAQLHLFFSWAHDLALHPRVLDAVQDILGDDLLVHSSTVFCKYPEDPRFVSWHQDGHYRGFDARLSVSAWIALSDSHELNGCVRVIPGSHQTLYDHLEVPDERNMLMSGMTIDLPDGLDDAADMVLRPGEYSLHHVDLVHSSGPNPTSEPRIGMAVRYIAADVRQSLPHHDVLLARGRNTGGHFTVLEEAPAGSVAECAERQRLMMAAYMEERSAAAALQENEP